MLRTMLDAAARWGYDPFPRQLPKESPDSIKSYVLRVQKKKRHLKKKSKR